MKKCSIEPFLWLEKRAQMYSTIAKNDFKQLKKVEFYFADPEAGWVDMTIRFDGNVVVELPLTGIWGDPLADLLRWTEECIMTTEIPHFIYHDGEGRDFVFHFEGLMFPPEDSRFDNCRFYETGIFSLFMYNLRDEKFIFTLCDILDFRKNLYTAICDFAERQKTNENAVRGWAWYIYDQKILGRYKDGEACDEEEDDRLARKMMLTNLRSRIIEKNIQGSRKK